MPGKTRFISLSPLSKGGDTLTVKIPLSSGRYYLIENRQPIGFDTVLPDSGILILRVDPMVQEGSGTVRVMNANPAVPNFSQATFRLDRKKGNIFIDKKHDVVVMPLWSAGEKQNLLVTTQEQSADALKSALMIQEIMDRHPKPRNQQMDQLIKNYVRIFRRYDFKGCRQQLTKKNPSL
ncbi:MAG: hypothetical protein PVI71_07380 [Desulfobacterales bacterium]